MRVYASAEMTLTDANDGISVTGIDRYYMASSSSEGIKVGSQGWMPEPQKTNPVSRYHWSYEVVNYSDGAKIPSKPAIIGVYGRNGEDGADAVTVSLSSEAHTFAGTESKAIASSITIDVSAFKGSQRISTSIGTVTGGISGKLTYSELGRGTTSNKLVINATSSLDKANGTLSIPIVADGRTFNKVFSWSVAFKGIPGKNGVDGKPTYTWIRYADTPTSGMSNSPVDKKYIGLSFNQTTKTESNNYNDYQWSLMPQNIDIGGRNLILDSGTPVESSAYMVAEYFISEDFVTGQKYTVTIKGTKNSTVNFGLWQNVGSSNRGHFEHIKDDLYQLTFTSVATTAGNERRIRIYQPPSGSASRATIQWIKLEKGNTATDWTPAPEDTQSEIDDTKEQVKKTVKTITEEYYQSTSSTSQTGSDWTETAPTWKEGKFIFIRSKITYVDGTTDYTPIVNITGAKGDTGDAGPRGATGSQGPRGPQGTSVDSITEYYLATTSGSGVTTSTAGWADTMQPMTSSKKYLWNYEKINFSDGTSQNTIPVIMGVYGDQGPQGSTGATGRSITGITEYYLATSASSGVTRSTSGWKTTMQPTTPTNKYLWNYERITWSSGTTTTYVEPIIIGVHGAKGDRGPQGAQGPRGATGSQGPRGATGTSVKSVTEYYLATSASSGILATNSGFTTTMQSMTATKKYLWNYEKINFSDGTSQPTIPVIIGVYGDKGQTGSTGATGRSIVSITEHYLATSASSGVTRSTSGWKTTMQPTTETNRYLWNYETIKWSSGTTTTYVEPIIIGVHGAKGPQGKQGPQGIQGPSGSNGQSQWVHIRYSANSNGSGMGTSPTSTTKYVGIAVTNSSSAPGYTGFTWSKYVGEQGDEGPRGLPGDNGKDGKTTYTWVRYADTPTSGMENFPEGKKYIGLAFNKTTQTESNNYSDYQWSLMPQNIEIGGRNLIGFFNVTERLWINTNGSTSVINNTFSSDYIDVEGYKFITATQKYLQLTTVGAFSLYDENKTFIARTSGNGKIFTTEIPSNVKFVRYSGKQPDGKYEEGIKVEKGNTATDWTPAPEDIEAAYTAVAQAKAEAERANAEAYADGIVSDEEKARIKDANAKLAAAKQYAVDQILADKTIKDTRNDNQTPAWYYTNHRRQTIKEFKLTSTIGVVSSEGTYGILETEIPWNDASGGPVKQTFRVNSKTFKRSGTTTSWSSWVSYDDMAETAKSDAATAKRIADGAASSASTANSLLADIASDSKLTPTEKKAAKKEWDVIVGEKPKIDSSAVTYGIITQKTAYNTAYNTLKNYLSGLLANLNTTSNIVGTTFRANFKAYYNARQDLLNKISDGAKSLVDEIEIGGVNMIVNSNEFDYSTTGTNINTNIIINVTEPLIVGKEYTFSFDIKATANGKSNRIFINSSMTIYKDFNFTSEWTRHFVTFVYNGGSYSGRQIHPHLYPDMTGTKYIRNVKLETGNKATDWTPAPEDTQSQIDNIESGIGDLYLADKTGVLSGREVFTDKADEGGLAYAEIDGKSVGGGRNLVVDGDITRESNAYFIHRYKLREKIEVGQVYTVVVKGSINGNQRFGVWTHGASNNQAYIPNNGSEYHIATFTGSANQTYLPDDSFSIYNYPSDGAKSAKVEWVKLVKGTTNNVEYELQTPAPDYPVEIHNLNDFDMVSSVGRRNIYTGEKDIDHVLDMNTYTIASHLPVGKYTISFDYDVIEENMSIVNFLLYSSVSGTFSNVPMKTGGNSRVFRTFTVTDDIAKGHIWLYAGRGSAESRANHIVFKDVKIEKGSTATSYAPAPEDVTEDSNHPLIDKSNLLLDEPLRSVGNVKDKLYRGSNGLWKVERNVGSFNISSSQVSTTTQAGGSNSYHLNGSVGYIISIRSNPSLAPSTKDIGSSHFVYTRSNNFNSENAEVGTIHQLGNETHRFFVRVSESTIGAVEGDSASTLVSKFNNWSNSQNVTIQYRVETPTIDILPMPIQNKLNSLSSFAKSNYVYTVNNNNLNPNLNVVFKSKGWRHKLATDKLEIDMSDKADKSDVEEDFSDVINSIDEFRSNYESYQDSVAQSMADASTELQKSLERTATIETTLGEGAADWIFTQTHIRMSNEGVTIGQEEAGSYLQISNNQISFFNGSEEPVAFINGGMLHINHAIFVESIQISGFMVSSEIKDHITFRYVGN